MLKLLRTPSLFDIALFDCISVLIMAWFINKKIKEKYIINNPNLLDLITVLILFIVGIFSHYIFKIDTKLGFYLNLNKDPRIKNV